MQSRVPLLYENQMEEEQIEIMANPLPNSLRKGLLRVTTKIQTELILPFLPIEDRLALRLTSTQLKELDVEIYKYIKLCELIEGIREGRLIMQTRSDIKCKFSIQLLFMAITALSTWGAVECGKATYEAKESDTFEHGIIFTSFLSIVDLYSLYCLVKSLSNKACISEKIRPSETTGNLRRGINQYNEIVPNIPLEDRLMSSEEYLAAFERGINELKRKMYHRKNGTRNSFFQPEFDIVVVSDEVSEAKSLSLTNDF